MGYLLLGGLVGVTLPLLNGGQAMSKKEDNKISANQKYVSTIIKEKAEESDNIAKMINASRAFRNIPPELVMGSNEHSGEK